MGMRAAPADFAAGLDEIDAVIVVLLDPRRDRKDIGIENNVLGRKSIGYQQCVGARANLHLAGAGVGLPLFIERHHDDGGAIALHLGGLFQKGRFAFLHADRIDDRLARNAFQPGFNDAPLRAVDHDRNTRDIGFGGDQLQKRRHGVVRVEQAFVHVDIKHLRAAFDLLARDFNGGGIIARHDEFLESGGAGDIGPLANIDEHRAGSRSHEIRPPISWGQGRSTGSPAPAREWRAADRRAPRRPSP